MAKLLKTLTKVLDLDTYETNAYFDYIILTLMNGQRQQVRSLFNDMRKEDKKDFLTFLTDHEYLNTKELLSICIDELLNNIPHIIVGCPGRVYDMFRRKLI